MAKTSTSEPAKGWPVFLAVVVAAAAADLLSKQWIFARLGMPGESAAIVGILALVSRPSTRSDGWILLALGLIVGGIIGNLFDRLGLPGLNWHAPLAREGEPVLAVRDWIHFTLPGVIDWPIFNLADSWLVIGAMMLLALSFLESRAIQAAGDDTPRDSERA
jgi:signal peptidase II